jgi:hypothetical protein
VKPGSNAYNYFRKKGNAEIIDLQELEEELKMAKIGEFLKRCELFGLKHDMVVGDNSL